MVTDWEGLKDNLKTLLLENGFHRIMNNYVKELDRSQYTARGRVEINFQKYTVILRIWHGEDRAEASLKLDYDIASRLNGYLNIYNMGFI